MLRRQQFDENIGALTFALDLDLVMLNSLAVE